MKRGRLFKKFSPKQPFAVSMKSPKKHTLAALLFILLAGITSCVSSMFVDARKNFYEGDFAGASASYEKLSRKKGKNKILALLEYGLALHEAQEYQKSAQIFLEADKQIKKEDVFHLGGQTTSLVANEKVKTYVPETFEVVLLHTYSAMNFMLLDDWQSARVEARRIHETLDELPADLQSQYFARFVSGLAYEVMGDLDDAYIEYAKIGENVPVEAVISPLVRISRLRGKREEAEKWARMLNESWDAPRLAQAPNLVLFVGAGRAPVKKEINIFIPPNANRFAIPEYFSSGSRAHHAVMKIGGISIVSNVLTDLDDIAKKTLQKRMAQEILKATARLAAKEAIAREIEEKNPYAGFAVRLAFIAVEGADTRSWEGLPRYLGVATAHVPAGEYKVEIRFLSESGELVDVPLHRDVSIREGRITVLSIRSVK